MIWYKTKRSDLSAAKIADRHYSRQTIGSPQFTPPGRVLVMVTKGYDALWATSWPYAEYVNREFPDAWVNCIFRNESNRLASEMILQAIAATRAIFGEPPADGMVTMIDTEKVMPIKRRGSPIWGYTYLKSGFKQVSKTKSGLLIFQLRAQDMPDPKLPNATQMKFPGI